MWSIPGVSPHRQPSGDSVTTTAIITFVLIAGFVWGGFAYLAWLAMRKEKAKIRSQNSGGDRPPS
jgi:threonine/homoserine/homoserine lactone efflux protein